MSDKTHEWFIDCSVSMVSAWCQHGYGTCDEGNVEDIGLGQVEVRPIELS